MTAADAQEGVVEPHDHEAPSAADAAAVPQMPPSQECDDQETGPSPEGSPTFSAMRRRSTQAGEAVSPLRLRRDSKALEERKVVLDEPAGRLRRDSRASLHGPSSDEPMTRARRESRASLHGPSSDERKRPSLLLAGSGETLIEDPAAEASEVDGDEAESTEGNQREAAAVLVQRCFRHKLGGSTWGQLLMQLPQLRNRYMSEEAKLAGAESNPLYADDMLVAREALRTHEDVSAAASRTQPPRSTAKRAYL